MRAGRPRVLDLFCGAGGASVGLWRAGWMPEGVDLEPQRYYPFTFTQADALEVLADRRYLEQFDAVWASPPCQDHSLLIAQHEKHGTGWMLEATLEALRPLDVPWIVENVATAPLASAPTLFGHYGVMLCGSMFGLGTLEPRRQLRRHRLFETSFAVPQPQCRHRGLAIGVYGHGLWDNNANPGQRGGWQGNAAQCAEAMGIDWCDRGGVVQAVPPAYAHHIGAQLLAYIERREVLA